jgi:hypothetical protein
MSKPVWDAQQQQALAVMFCGCGQSISLTERDGRTTLLEVDESCNLTERVHARDCGVMGPAYINFDSARAS